ncbi:sigma-B regulation protein RsbU (phosphoserine phosphatase) [Alteribacillus persepolensis]|uniref:Sigma-B regulation protein RsbU (Phosphoserine phosphatase) n=1 Tax=Alteribacillus persepolensis TaxID=568899 RepID=A0A1G8FFW1_9BACI|nr:PP2C family protein-serine/threonine phosphatase [Alteribacillus persepolensis]SDH80976.1 sigma-B regulation protein RsbU (phosphoserine phosphatase) [Alteribacillus persepolensis]
MADSFSLMQEQYTKILKKYLEEKNETGLYHAQQFSKKVLENQISPEEVVSLHLDALEKYFPDLPQGVFDSFEFLLEVMMGYGMAYREHQSLRDKQKELETEINVAASMQQTFLPKEIPSVDALDVGVISVPASKMSGDYYHFIKDDNDCIGVAIADIIGKGVPAALCMSMIKYAMDSLPEQRLQPGALLDNLNRVVEQNVASNMFITMMYGSYDPRVHHFYYSGAGHEPGFYYHYDTDTFEELYAKGLVLGIKRDTTFREYHKKVEPGDFIVLLSDGVTECRTDDGFIEREELTRLIRKYKHLPAQEIVDNVFYQLEKLQGFQLRDDFSLIILRRKV